MSIIINFRQIMKITLTHQFLEASIFHRQKYCIRYGMYVCISFFKVGTIKLNTFSYAYVYIYAGIYLYTYIFIHVYIYAGIYLYRYIFMQA